MHIDPFSRDDVLDLLDSLGPREALFVAESEHHVLGWGIVKMYSSRPGYRKACETSVYVFREHTGKGIGSSIQTSLMDHAESNGFHHVVTRVWADNAGSRAFHRHFGFTLVGIQNEVGEVDGQKKDIAVMQCLL
jgi:L-amino acid N-acyltransferase YncA